MPIEKNLLRRELAGLEAEVLDCSNKSCVGIKGIVLDETKNMIVIETENGEKIIQKKGTVFMLAMENKKIKVDGNLLVGMPKKRKRLKKW